MNLAFFLTALLMGAIAIGFVAVPLVVNERHSSRGSINLPLLGALVVFGLGIALYAVIGRPGAESHVAAYTAAKPSAAGSETGSNSDKVGSVASLLTGLEVRLAHEMIRRP